MSARNAPSKWDYSGEEKPFRVLDHPPAPSVRPLYEGGPYKDRLASERKGSVKPHEVPDKSEYHWQDPGSLSPQALQRLAAWHAQQNFKVQQRLTTMTGTPGTNAPVNNPQVLLAPIVPPWSKHPVAKSSVLSSTSTCRTQTNNSTAEPGVPLLHVPAHVSTAHRCERCMRRKKYCSGDLPVCRACADGGHQCLWPPYQMTLAFLTTKFATGGGVCRPAGNGYPATRAP